LDGIDDLGRGIEDPFWPRAPPIAELGRDEIDRAEAAAAVLGLDDPGLEAAGGAAEGLCWPKTGFVVVVLRPDEEAVARI